MARRISVEIIGDSRSLERAFKRSGSAADSFQGKIGSASFGAAKKVAYLGGALTGLAIVAGAKAVNAAANLSEQITKTSVVFGKSAKAIQAWARTTSGSIGISNRAALEAAGVFGNMLVPMGVARRDAARMSKRMVTLAADMASFNNASPEETLDALRAGLAGESEPLRRFGVFLNDARLKQEALNLGIYEGKGPLDAIAKAQATYSLILKDTKDAQGDFKRTSDSLPNAMRSIRASVEDLQAAFGEGLLPVVQKVAKELKNRLADPAFRERIRALGKEIGEKLLKAVEAIGRWFEQNWEGIKSAFKTGAELAKDLAAATQRVHEWLKKVAAVTPGGAQTMFGMLAGGVLLSKLGLLNKLLLVTLGRLRLISKVPPPIVGGGGKGGGGKTGGGKAGGKGWKGFIPGVNPATAVAAVVVASAGGGTQMGDRSGSYPLTYAAVRSASKGNLGPHALKIIKDAIGKYSLANAPEKRLSEAERRLAQLYEDQRRRREAGPYGGPRAKGGGVLAGRRYLVGEKGPETLVMGNRGGHIVPNGGSGISIQTVHVHGVQNVQQLLSELQRVARHGVAQQRGRYGGSNVALG